MWTLTQALSLCRPPENSVPSRSAVSLGGTKAQDKLERGSSGRRGSGTRVVEEGLSSRRLTPLARTSTPGTDSSLVGYGVGPDLKGFSVSRILRTAFLTLPPSLAAAP